MDSNRHMRNELDIFQKDEFSVPSSRTKYKYVDNFFPATNQVANQHVDAFTQQNPINSETLCVNDSEWTQNESALLQKLDDEIIGGTHISRCIKIAKNIPNKSVRQVALALQLRISKSGETENTNNQNLNYDNTFDSFQQAPKVHPYQFPNEKPVKYSKPVQKNKNEKRTYKKRQRNENGKDKVSKSGAKQHMEGQKSERSQANKAKKNCSQNVKKSLGQTKVNGFENEEDIRSQLVDADISGIEVENEISLISDNSSAKTNNREENANAGASQLLAKPIN